MRGYTPCGEKIEKVYGYFVDKDGRKVFGVVGTTNVYERIQSSVTGSTLYEMIDKYQKTGDDSFLRAKAEGFYGDVTGLPKSMFEVNRVKTQAIQDFSKYPLEFRKLFNHNVEDYFSSILDGSIKGKFDKFFGKQNVKDDVNIVPKVEVKKDE